MAEPVQQLAAGDAADIHGADVDYRRAWLEHGNPGIFVIATDDFQLPAGTDSEIVQDRISHRCDVV